MSWGRNIQLALATLCCLLSCKGKEEPFTPVECKYFIEETAPYREITFDELFSATVKKYKDRGIDTESLLAPYSLDIQKLRLASTHYTAFSITYHSLDPEGNPVVASAVIYYPFTIRPRGVIEICPGNESKEDCATKNIFQDEVFCGTMGYICLVPDLLGSGSTDGRPMAHLQSESKAQMSADLRIAAKEFIHNRYRVDIPESSYILGFGLGGAHALSLARLYQEHPEMGVTVEEVDAGGGFYNLPSVLDELFDGGDHDLHLLEKMLRSAVDYNGLDLDTGCISNPEVFSPGKEAYDRTRENISTLSIDSKWIPQCKVVMMHSASDPVSPVGSAEKFINDWETVGAAVQYTRMDTPREAVFFQGGGELIKRLLNQQ